MSRLDPFENDVDDTYEKITSYIRIVKNTMCDMVPKAITNFIIQNLQEYIKKKLLIKLPEISNDERVSHSIVFYFNKFVVSFIICS